MWTIKRQNIAGLIGFLLAFAIFWFVTSYGMVDFAFYSGQVIADTLFLSLFLLVILAFTPYRKTVGSLAIVGFSCFMVVSYLSIDIVSRGKDERATAESLIGVIESMKSGKSISVPSQENPSNISVLIGNYASSMQSIYSSYSIELQNAGLDQILLPQNFLNPSTSKTFSGKINHLESILAKCEKDAYFEYEKLEKQLSQLTDSAGQEAYRSVVAARPRNLKQTALFFDVEKKIFKTINDLLALSINSHDSIHLQDGRLLFDNQKLLDSYNTSLAQLSDLSAQEAKIMAEQQARLDDTKKAIQAKID
jgi:hypothetical protein